MSKSLWTICGARRPVAAVLFVVGLLVVGTGCRSTAEKPAAARFASLEIQGNTPGQIRDVTVEVFREQGFKLAQPGLSNMTFEKEGSGMSQFAYGDWMGSQVWVRARVAIVPVAEGRCRLQCNAFMVRDKGNPTEEEVKLSSFRAGTYRKLLEEVARRLNGTGTVPRVNGEG